MRAGVYGLRPSRKRAGGRFADRDVRQLLIEARDDGLNGMRPLITSVCDEVDAAEPIGTSIEQRKIVHRAIPNRQAIAAIVAYERNGWACWLPTFEPGCSYKRTRSWAAGSVDDAPLQDKALLAAFGMNQRGQ